MTTIHANPVRSALRALSLFTLVTANPTTPYYSTYTGQFSGSVSGTSVF